MINGIRFDLSAVMAIFKTPPVIEQVLNVELTKAKRKNRDVRRANIFDALSVPGVKMTIAQVSRLFSIAESTAGKDLKALVSKENLRFESVKINQDGKGFYEGVYFV